MSFQSDNEKYDDRMSVKFYFYYSEKIAEYDRKSFLKRI